MSFSMPRRRRLFTACKAAGLAVALIAHQAVLAAVVRVPGDWPSIQAAVAAARDGDTVLVAPGVYHERIEVVGKGLDLRSESGPEVTIIDAMRTGTVVAIVFGPETRSSLTGFTLRNGYARSDAVGRDAGGGVQVWFGAATIENNIIEGNVARSGSGIYVENARVVVRNNRIAGNAGVGCCNGTNGAGIFASGMEASISIVRNVIEGNRAGDSSEGGGIAFFNLGGPALIDSNIISGNDGGRIGGAYVQYNQGGKVTFVNNLIAGNAAAQAGGLYFTIVADAPGPELVNNTIADNVSATGGSQIQIVGWAGTLRAANNIVYGSTGTQLLYCDPAYSPLAPTFTHSLIYSPVRAVAGGICSGVPGAATNINADPLFAAPTRTRRYAPGGRSPAIDAGDNARVGAARSDLAGRTRIADGNGDGRAVVDIGAYEY